MRVATCFLVGGHICFTSMELVAVHFVCPRQVVRRFWTRLYTGTLWRRCPLHPRDARRQQCLHMNDKWRGWFHNGLVDVHHWCCATSCSNRNRDCLDRLHRRVIHCRVSLSSLASGGMTMMRMMVVPPVVLWAASASTRKVINTHCILICV